MMFYGLFIAGVLMTSHFIADFVCQSDAMAINKSSSWFWLSYHVAVYMFVMFMCLCVAITILGFPNPATLVFMYVVVNGVLHFITDAITSRVSSYLYKKEMRHWFFVCIGFDQLVHALTLFATAVPFSALG